MRTKAAQNSKVFGSLAEDVGEGDQTDQGAEHQGAALIAERRIVRDEVAQRRAQGVRDQP